jgi:hypothetical protein
VVKIAGFEVRRNKRIRLTIEQKVSQHVASQDVRHLVARMARSEVKNYLGELAEQSGIPYDTPVQVIRELHVRPGHNED